VVGFLAEDGFVQNIFIYNIVLDILLNFTIRLSKWFQIDKTLKKEKYVLSNSKIIFSKQKKSPECTLKVDQGKSFSFL
jgi:hypothetical protein